MLSIQSEKKLALILLAISSIGVVGYSFFAYLVLSPGSTVHPRMKAAAVTLRIYLGVFFRMGLNFDDFYPSLGWVSWVPNLVFVEWFLVRQLREELKTSVSPVKGDSRGST